MKLARLCSMAFTLHFSLGAYAFSGHDQFKVELVKPWGEYGFRALGKGKHSVEMRFDCAKTSEMGLVVSIVNDYGKTSNFVLPADKLGVDKQQCHNNLKKYFASLSFKRGLASSKNESRMVDLSFQDGNKTLSFR